MGGPGSGRKSVEKFAPTPEQVEELKRCARDPSYFAQRYCKIQHPERGTIPLKTYPFQDKCLRAFQKHKFNIVLKSRQLGLSTISAAYSVWMALFKRDKNILVIATKLSTAKNFIRKVAKILDCLPPWMRICSYDTNQQDVKFENGSQIKAVPTTEDAGRSEALSLLIIDEAAFVRNFEEIWTALAPTLSEGGGAIVLSTPNGVGGQYYDLWVGAETNGFDDDAVGKNGFHPILLPWDVHPEHGEEYFEKMSKKLGARKTAQELLCDFLSSGETFLKAPTMTWLSQEQRAPISQEGPEFAVWIWKQPEKGHKYLIGADVARGDANDNSTFVVIDMNTGEEVAEYCGKIYPDGMAEILNDYGRKYNNALVAVEANTFGNHTLIDLKKLSYPNIFYRTAPKHSIEMFYAGPKDKAGFDTQTASRMEALVRFEDSMRCHVVTPRSNRFHEEAQSFVWIDDKPQAKKGKRDDLVMAMAIASWVYRTHFENYRLGCKANGGSNGHEKPLFMYMSKTSRTFHGGINPRVAISTSSMNTQTPAARAVPLEEHSKQVTKQAQDDEQLNWLLR